MSGFLIKNLTRSSYIGQPYVFSAVVKEVLPGWDVSLVFIGPAKARALNKQLRKKSYVPNVLSYIVGEKSCEIIICPSEVRRQAPSFQLPASSLQLLVFIHGVLHIKGWSHGATMEACEQKLLKKYGTKNSDRHRHRHVPGKDGRGRGTLR